MSITGDMVKDLQTPVELEKDAALLQLMAASLSQNIEQFMLKHEVEVCLNVEVTPFQNRAFGKPTLSLGVFMEVVPMPVKIVPEEFSPSD
jgi:hypothetical protein